MPTELLDQAITQLLAMVRSLPDLQVVFDVPPESMGEGQFPCAIAYPYQGSIGPVVASRRMTGESHTINLDIHQARIIHPAAFTAIRVWPDRITALLFENQTLNGTVRTIMWPVPYEAVEMPYGREIHYGMRFSITARIY